MKLKKTAPSEELLILAAAQLRDYKMTQNSVRETPTAEISRGIQERVFRIYDAYEKKKKRKNLLRTLVSSLIALALAGGAAAYGNPDLRERFGDWVREQTKNQLNYLYNGGLYSLQSEKLFSVDAAFFDEYQLQKNICRPGYYIDMYRTADGHTLSIQVAEYGFSMNIGFESDEDLAITRGTIGDKKYEFVQGTQAYPTSSLIVWDDQNRVMVNINSVFTLEEAIDLYQKIIIKF